MVHYFFDFPLPQKISKLLVEKYHNLPKYQFATDSYTFILNFLHKEINRTHINESCCLLRSPFFSLYRLPRTYLYFLCFHKFLHFIFQFVVLKIHLLFLIYQLVVFFIYLQVLKFLVIFQRLFIRFSFCSIMFNLFFASSVFASE